jgi:small conductance mechanosensitive channel
VMSGALERKQLDTALRLMLLRFARIGILGVSLTIALELCGFPMTALITSIGVVGVGIGFAMQGLLSNIIAGLTIIVTKPFRLGEFVGILNCTGVVDSIDLTTTTLHKPDGSRILIPNSKVINEVLQNYGVVRQLDLNVGVSYATDLTRVQVMIQEILRCNPRVLREPAPAVLIAGMGDSAVNVAIKPFVKLQDMGAAMTELNQAIVEKFRAGNIEIPYAQHEVRILNGGANVVKN